MWGPLDSPLPLWGEESPAPPYSGRRIPFSWLGLGSGSSTPSPWGIWNGSLCRGRRHHWQVWWRRHGTLRWRDTGEARAPTKLPLLSYGPMVIGPGAYPLHTGPQAYQFVAGHPLKLCLHVREVLKRVIVPYGLPLGMVVD